MVNIFKQITFVIIVLLLTILTPGCFAPKDNNDIENSFTSDEGVSETIENNPRRKIPQKQRWGIYSLDLEDQGINLIYSDSEEISFLHLNSKGNKFVFSKKINGEENDSYEVCILNIDGTGFKRLTENNYWDVYPIWSPDGSMILFLSFRDQDLDIYIMDDQGHDIKMLYDSGDHDADIDWTGDKIVFTSRSSIWIMNEDGNEPRKLTNPPRAGEWGDAVLPFGDYDPRLSNDGKRIIFERLVDDNTEHGNYDLFTINPDGTDLKQITKTGYTQGLANWSKDSLKILYLVSAMGNTGMYDMFLISSNGEDNQNITPAYFPDNFLCHNPIFSPDESEVIFIGEWWEE
jgi:TolB protein